MYLIYNSFIPTLPPKTLHVPFFLYLLYMFLATLYVYIPPQIKYFVLARENKQAFSMIITSMTTPTRINIVLRSEELDYRFYPMP